MQRFQFRRWQQRGDKAKRLTHHIFTSIEWWCQPIPTDASGEFTKQLGLIKRRFKRVCPVFHRVPHDFLDSGNCAFDEHQKGQARIPCRRHDNISAKDMGCDPMDRGPPEVCKQDQSSPFFYETSAPFVRCYSHSGAHQTQPSRRWAQYPTGHAAMIRRWKSAAHAGFLAIRAR